MSPPSRRRPSPAKGAAAKRRAAGQSVTAVLPPAHVAAPPTAETVATLIPIEAHRPNLLDTGLSDYGMWVEIVNRMSPPPLPTGQRPGRIWL